jgi:phosphodiesterase/alkaline phosphatase D-like protein
VLAVSPIGASGLNLFAGTKSGLYLSTNNGTSWTAVNTGMANTYIKSLAVSPTGTGGTNLFAGTNGGVYLSTNNGTSWLPINNGLGNNDNGVESFAIVNGTDIFAETFGSGVYLSTNAGTSWTSVNTGLTYPGSGSLVVSGNYLFAGTSSGVWMRPLSEMITNIQAANTSSATGITSTTATLNGAVNPNGTSTTVQFDYGTTTSYGNTATASQSPVTGSSAVSVSANITGLTPNTLYHFRVKATSGGVTIYGADSTFTTLPNVVSTKVSVNLPTLIRQQGSSPEWINITVGDLTGQNVSAFQFTLSYTKSVIYIDSAITGPVAAGGSFVFNADTVNQQIKVAFASANALSGSGTLVQLKVHYINSGTSPLAFNNTFEFNEGTPVASVTEGSITVSSNVQLPPTVTTLSATTIGSTSSTLNGIANANGSSTTVQFDYGTTTSYSTTVTASQSPLTGSSNVSVSANIISLTPNTLYHYRVKATNSAGTTYGTDSTFTTLSTSQFWVQTNGPYPYVEILTLAINSSGYVFAGTNGSAAYLSTNNGTSWTQLYKGLSNSHVRSLAINSAGYVFAGTDGGVNLSTNNGTSWTPINSGLETDTLVQTLAINSAGYIFAGTSSGGVFLSTNNGTSWSPVNNGLTTGNVHTLAINSSDYFFAGTVGGGVFLSTNNGSSWSPVNTGITNTSIWTLAVNSSGNVFAGTYGGGVFLSTNNGTSWTAQNNGLPNGSYIYSLAINSAGYLFAGMGNLNLGVYASTNNGTSWALAGLQDNNVSAVAVNSSGYVFAGTYAAGVYRTSNPTVYIPIPQAPVLASPANSSTGISINPALSWNVSTGSTSYRLQVSADSTFATTIYDTSGVTFTSKIISSLSYQVKYFWRVNATNTAGTSGWSNIWNFTTISNINLVVITNSATNITQTAAYLNGTVNPNGISSTTVQFDYGTSISYGTTVYASPNPVTGNSNINVYANINGLTANTLYHFRLKAINSNGTSYGADSTFITLNVNVQPSPSVTTLSATSIGSTSATLNGMVNANGASSAVQFDYGTSTSYGATITASLTTGSTPVNDSAQIGNLTPYTLYHYRVEATNSGGTSHGSDMTFTTKFIYPSSISLSQSYTFGDPTQSSSYKLIGLPGNLNSLLTQILPGTPKQDWDAYYDNGAADNSYSITLNNGWNVISNPFDKSVVWDSVISVNSLDSNLIIYGWNSGWSTPGSFDPYKGYYFYNQHNLPSLKIPYNPNGTIGKSIIKAAVFNLNDGTGPLRMSLNIGNEEKSFVIISIDSTSSNDYDIHDLLAPPGDFEDAGITLHNEKLSINYKNLLKESRPMMGSGQAFDINITDKQKKQVILKSEGVNNFKVSEVFLLDIYNSRLYNLKENNSIVLNPNQESKYQILIGNTDFIKTAEKEILPTEFKLFQNYPNPFNPVTTIEYSIPNTSFVTIKVYNILGKEVATLVNEEKQAGNFSVQLAIGNKQLASGVYFYRMQAGSFVNTKKLVLLK